MSERISKKISIVDYLNRKQMLRIEQEQILQKLNGPCLHCFRPQRYCLCSLVVTVQTNNKFVFLMHPKEARRERVGTGRLTHLCLSNSDLLVGEHFHQDSFLHALLEDRKYQSVLLYPGQKSFSLGNGALPSQLMEKPLQIFVLDGTWPCARSMMRDTPELHSLPRISFQHDKRSEFSIKQQPHPACLSTIESVHVTLEHLEKLGLESLGGIHNSMLNILQHIVSFQKECARDPGRNRYRSFSPGGHKPIELRRPSKRWENRNVFYD